MVCASKIELICNYFKFIKKQPFDLMLMFRQRRNDCCLLRIRNDLTKLCLPPEVVAANNLI